NRGHAESTGPRRHILRTAMIGKARAFRITVVLDDENCRKLQHDGKVHRLEDGALVRCAIADKRNRDAARLECLGRKRRTDRERGIADDNAVCTEHALVKIGDMHGAALAAAKPARLAEDFEHHALDITSLGKGVPVAAMRRAYNVTIVQMCAYACGRCFLSDIEVNEAGNVTVIEFI